MGGNCFHGENIVANYKNHFLRKEKDREEKQGEFLFASIILNPVQSEYPDVARVRSQILGALPGRPGLTADTGPERAPGEMSAAGASHHGPPPRE